MQKLTLLSIIIKTFFLLLLWTNAGHSFEFTLKHHTQSTHSAMRNHKDSQKHHNKLFNIHFGFIGNDNYDKRKLYLDNCFANNCTSFGINFKVNFSVNDIFK